MDSTTRPVKQIFDETISSISHFDPTIKNKIEIKMTSQAYLSKDHFYSLSKLFCFAFSQYNESVSSIILETVDETHCSVSITLSSPIETNLATQFEERAVQYGLESFIYLQNSASELIIEFPVVAYAKSKAILKIEQLIEYFPDFESAKMLIELYFEGLDSKIVEVEEQINASDWTVAHRLCHSLKGGAFTICAMRLGNALKILEEELKQIMINNNKISYNKMQSDIGTVKDEAKTCLNYWNHLDLNAVKEHFNGST